MPWLHLHKGTEVGLDDAVDELTSESSHRAVAIVGGAFVENHLTTLLQTRLRRDEKLIPEMFRSAGPLGPFGTKINFGYLMGLYSQEAQRELATIKDIRNAFAHRLTLGDFDSSPAKEWCSNLKLWEQVKIKLSNTPTGDGKIRMAYTVGRGLAAGEKEIMLNEPLIHPDGFTPRRRYLNACRFFAAALTALVVARHVIKEPLF